MVLRFQLNTVFVPVPLHSTSNVIQSLKTIATAI